MIVGLFCTYSQKRTIKKKARLIHNVNKSRFFGVLCVNKEERKREGGVGVLPA